MERHTYIPPHVQKAMDEHLHRSTLPAHLRKYTEGSQDYIPRQAEIDITRHMEKAVNEPFKKYADAYVQQRVMSQGVANANAMPQPAEEQYAAPPQAVSSPGQTFSPTSPPEPTPGPPPPAPPPAPLYPGSQAPVPVQSSQEYNFITSPEKPAKLQWQLPGGNSMATRALMAAGGLLVLIIIFVIIKGLFSGGGSNLTLFVGVAQDQQELIHLATNASQQKGITVNNQNFAATTQLSLASSQAAIVKYLSANSRKVNPKTLNLKLSTSLDNQLVNAAAATTYDQTFQEITKTKLTAYLSDLQQTYKQTKGKNGRVLLSDDYNQAQLLLTQLNAPPQ
jgi:hypothetical protein